jgi:uncharacterized protein
MNYNILNCKDNSYTFGKNKENIFIHPIMLYLIEHPDSECDTDYLINKYSCTKEEIEYFRKKIEFLKSTELLELSKPQANNIVEFPSGIVDNNLDNLKSVVFEVTDGCNLACKYCAYREMYDNYKPRNNQYLSYEKAQKVIDFLFAKWRANKISNKRVYWNFYGGEPLLNMDFITKVVSYLEQKKNEFKDYTFIYQMTTNGMLLDKYIDYLIEHNFRLLISLDGNEYNNSYRVTKANVNSYSKVFSNVSLVMSKKPSYFKSNINFNSVLHSNNSIEGVLKFFKKNFNKIPSIGEINAHGVKTEMRNQFNNMFKSTIDSVKESPKPDLIIHKLALSYSENTSIAIFSYQMFNNFFNNYNELLLEKKREKVYPTGTCSPFSRKLFVTVRGEILPCEKIGQNHVLGNVNENGVELSSDMIVNSYNEVFATLSKQCSSCYGFDTCLQCVFSNDDETKCNRFMNRDKYMKMISKKHEYIIDNPNLFFDIVTNHLLMY